MNVIKKRRLTIFVVLILCMSMLYGCGSSKTDYADNDFLKSMAKGLEARWDIAVEKVEAGSQEDLEYSTKLVDAELPEVEDFASATFENTNLQELAIKYINLLKQQKEALNYLTADYEKYEKLWSEAYNQRTKLIVQIDKDYKLPISSKYEDTLKEMTTNAKSVEEKEQLVVEIEKMLDGGKFKKKESYGNYECTLAVTNTTNKEFTNFSAEINFLDKGGAVVESTSDWINNWKPNMKMKFKFYVTEKFDKYQVQAGDYQVKE